MNRHRSYFPSDESPQTDGDAAFRGVNSREHPAVLQEGYVAEARNVRFDTGAAATRKGVRIMAWGAQGYQGYDPAVILPYGDVITGATFSDPIGGMEWLMISTTGGVFRARPGTMGSRLDVVPGEDVATAVQLVQTYNGMVMLRGADGDPLYMDSLEDGWRKIPDAAKGKEKMPRCRQGIYIGNRFVGVDARQDQVHADSVWVSDFGGVSSVLQGDTTYNAFRINQGSADRLTGIAKFNDTTVVCAKGRSIYVVSEVYGTNDALAQNARLDEVTSQYGCMAPKSFVEVGNDLWFLGHRRGICSIRQTETNALQGVDVPTSREIQGTIDRINWEAARLCVAASHDNRIYFAVPIDGATRNNAVLVYDTVNAAWAGYDTGDAIQVREWVKFSYAGAVRLGFLTHTGYVAMYEDGYYDHVGDGLGNISYRPIETLLRSRGYGGKISGPKRFTRMLAKIRTWRPSYTLVVRADGIAEARAVGSVTRGNVRYVRPHGKADWNPINSAGDWDSPFREDYAVAAEGMHVTNASGDGTVAFGVLQEWEESRRLRINGQHVQAEMQSSRGRLEVASVSVDMQRGPCRNGSYA